MPNPGTGFAEVKYIFKQDALGVCRNAAGSSGDVATAWRQVSARSPS